jgi:nitroreductase
LKRLSRRLVAAYGERRITCAPGAVRPVCEHVMSRGRECADLMTPLIESMGHDFKSYVNEGSLQFYGATVAILMFLDEAFFPERLPDIGMFAAYLLLGAEARGVGSCPIGLVRAYEEEVKDALNVPETKTLVMAVALGRPDEGAAINRFRSPRIGIEECVRWID